MSEDVSFKELAIQLEVDQSTIQRLVQKHGDHLGLNLKRGETNTINAKWAYFLSKDDADKLLAFYEARRTLPVSAEFDDASLQRFGTFYVIQLVPEALPNRIKVGYTDNLEDRLASHRTAAPTARVLSTWPCKRSWDYAAMDCITREGCVWVLNEVFEGDPQGFINRANAFFAIMPKADVSRSLSDHSPLRKGNSA